MKYLAIILLSSQLLSGATLIDGTEDTYTDGKVVWEGNPWCAELGLFPSAGMVETDDGNTVDASTVGACRNMRAAILAIIAPSRLTVEAE